MNEQQTDDLRRLSDLRCHVETFAARHATTQSRVNPDGMAKIDDALGRMKTALRVNAYPAFLQAPGGL